MIANIDVAALVNNSEDGMWIITVSETKLNLVELVGIYNGEQKPKNSDDLVEFFVDELKFFITNGFIFEDKIQSGISLFGLRCPGKVIYFEIKTP